MPKGLLRHEAEDTDLTIQRAGWLLVVVEYGDRQGFIWVDNTGNHA